MTTTLAQRVEPSNRGAEFSRLNKQGLSYTQIAQRYGSSRSAVAGAIHRHERADAVLAYKKKWYEPKHLENRARFIERRRERVANFVPRSAREQAICALYVSDEALSLAAIGERFGISGQRVRQLLIRPPKTKSAYRIALQERNARIIVAYENGTPMRVIARDETISQASVASVIRRADKSRRRGKPTRDLTGQRFGLLVATECAGRLRNSRENHWRCVCDCGGTVTTRRSNLVDGHTKSCGCQSRGRKAAA